MAGRKRFLAVNEDMQKDPPEHPRIVAESVLISFSICISICSLLYPGVYVIMNRRPCPPCDKHVPFRKRNSIAAPVGGIYFL